MILVERPKADIQTDRKTNRLTPSDILTDEKKSNKTKQNKKQKDSWT